MSNKTSEGRNWVRTVVIVLCGCIILSALGAAAFYYLPASGSNNLPVSVVKNTFVDINGDGKQDFVKYMEVIINDGSINPNP